MMNKQIQTLVRLYVIEGFNFASRDVGSYSDPYLIIKCGKITFNERENALVDEPNPKFYKHYDFEASFPGAPPIIV